LERNIVDTSNINLLDLIQRQVSLKKIGRKDGGEYAGPCPFCGGKDRFRVWPAKANGGRWWCRQEAQGGDAIAYIMRLDGCTFAEALTKLGLSQDRPRSYTYRSADRPRAATTIPSEPAWDALHSEAWQHAAMSFIIAATEELYTPPAAHALDYLYTRGFNDDTLTQYFIGYNRTERRTKWGPKEVYVPAGIVIPWLYYGDIWRVNIRRLDGKTPKYLQAGGGANGLYNAQAIRSNLPVVMVEGEFDCISIAQAAGDLVTPVATGSTSGSRLPRWLALLSVAPRHLVAFDTDAPGNAASTYWLDVLPGSVRLLPAEHDPNDMLTKQGPDAIRQWLATAI
jgi:DNA primase